MDKIWRALDGKKRITGFALLLVGMIGNKFDVPGADMIMYSGLGMLGVGVGHKVQKVKHARG